MRRSLLLLLASCVDGGVSSAGAGSTLDTPRILTVISEPPEAAPGTMVHLQAVVAPMTSAPPSWSLCTTPRQPIDNAAVSPACAREPQGASLGDALELDVRIPSDACGVFGSETPAGTTANAPDATGGYYQPLRVALADQLTVVRLRIQCPLAAAPTDAARDFTTRYVPNQAPTLGEPQMLVEGRRVELSVELSPPETYLRYDATRGVLEDALETQSVSWFVTAGSVTPELSVADTTAAAVWSLPPGVQDAQLFIVGRDDRGATTYLERTLHVTD